MKRSARIRVPDVGISYCHYELLISADRLKPDSLGIDEAISRRYSAPTIRCGGCACTSGRR
jgi:hypothetical protein